MANPARAEIQHAPAPGQVGIVVLPQERDGVVVDVGNEAGGGVEVVVRGGVGAGEVGRGVGEGRVARVVRAGGEGELGRGVWGCGGGHGCEEGGD